MRLVKKRYVVGRVGTTNNGCTVGWKRCLCAGVSQRKGSVEAIAEAGRTRWKVENEGINVLKNHGYNESLRTLTRFFYYNDWHQLLTFMYQGLELAPG